MYTKVYIDILFLLFMFKKCNIMILQSKKKEKKENENVNNIVEPSIYTRLFIQPSMNNIHFVNKYSPYLNFYICLNASK